jgi:hypothetical protein
MAMSDASEVPAGTVDQGQLHAEAGSTGAELAESDERMELKTLPTSATYELEQPQICPCGPWERSYDEFDSCLGQLEGLASPGLGASCGHNGQDIPYAHLADGSVIYGDRAIDWFLTQDTPLARVVHARWHVAHGVVNPTCWLCVEGQP